MAGVTTAFVLGAGLGMRLRPLTDHLPKPLVPIFHKPLITFAFDHLMAAGVQKLVVNTHRLPETFAACFPHQSYRGCAVSFVHEPVLLETGGGIKNAEAFLGTEPFITYSADVLTDANLGPLIDEHFSRENDVTLGLRATNLGAEVAFRDGRVIDVAGKYGCPGNYDFAGVAIWNSAIFARLVPGAKTSFFPILTKWIGENGRIGGTVLNDGKWFNIGSPAEYLNVHHTISAEGWKPRYVVDKDWPRPIHPRAWVHPAARLRGCSCVGENCRVEAEAVLTDTVLWTGARIASKSDLLNCVVRSRRTAEGVLRDAVI